VRTDLGDLSDLIRSIDEEGIIVPLMAEQRGQMLRILHGHRRAAAAKCCGVTKVPCVIVQEHTDDQAIALMIAENEQRRHLTAEEKQRAVLSLRDEFGWSAPDIARRLGISTATVYNWAKGPSAPPSAGAAQPSPPRARGRHRKPPMPRVRVDLVFDLVTRWRLQIEAGEQPGQMQLLLAEAEDLLKGWTPPNADTEGDPR
jgi:ParB-like chromosome segregation protein Spo0J